MIFILYFLSLRLFGVSPSIAHPIHVSLCELRYNEEAASFQVSLKIFIDDLEVAIKKEGYPPLNLGAATESELTQQNLAAYIDKNFFIELNGHKVESHFVGKELSDDYLAVWCYMEYPATISKSEICTITNRVLLDLYTDQRNIMDIKMNSTQKEYTIFDSSTNSWSYTY